MIWHYRTSGLHVHVTVYVNGALAGSLVFRIDEFKTLMAQHTALGTITFVPQDVKINPTP